MSNGARNVFTPLVASKRLQCAKNGEFEKFKGTALAHAWFIWEKDSEGNVIKQAPTIDWIRL